MCLLLLISFSEVSPLCSLASKGYLSSAMFLERIIYYLFIGGDTQHAGSLSSSTRDRTCVPCIESTDS